jgi:hypothetical protein
MSETPGTVDLHFNVAVAGKARRGQDVYAVERTPYVDALLEHGIASPIGGAAGAVSVPRADAGDLTTSGAVPQTGGVDETGYHSAGVHPSLETSDASLVDPADPADHADPADLDVDDEG